MKKINLKKLSFRIEGMHCSSCAFLIEDELSNQPGVIESSVSVGTKSASVLFDENQTNLVRLIEVISKLGNYRAQPIST